jgi:large subunit ribosomal protein L21
MILEVGSAEVNVTGQGAIGHLIRRSAGRVPSQADWAGIRAMTDQITATNTVADATYAVIATGGKQYRVKVGDRISVERLSAEAGSDLTLDQVLLVGGAGETKIGTPVVDGASVTAHVDEHDRGEKIVVFKFKAKKRYRRRTGHRQSLTRLTITGISA